MFQFSIWQLGKVTFGIALFCLYSRAFPAFVTTWVLIAIWFFVTRQNEWWIGVPIFGCFFVWRLDYGSRLYCFTAPWFAEEGAVGGFISSYLIVIIWRIRRRSMIGRPFKTWEHRVGGAVAAVLFLFCACLLWTNALEHGPQLIIDFPVSIGPEVGSEVYVDGASVGKVISVIVGTSHGTRVILTLWNRQDLNRVKIPTLVMDDNNMGHGNPSLFFVNATKQQLMEIVSSYGSTTEGKYKNGDYIPYGQVVYNPVEETRTPESDGETER